MLKWYRSVIGNLGLTDWPATPSFLSFREGYVEFTDPERYDKLSYEMYKKADREAEEANRGFAQGSALSPLLSVFAKSHSKVSQYDHIMYADDGLLYNLP